MTAKLTKIAYTKLNSRQKENYNFLKISAKLADYGFMTMRITDDWEGADFFAYHVDGKLSLKVQLKTRLSFSEKYRNKDIYVAFFDGNKVDRPTFLYDHDRMLEAVFRDTKMKDSASWKGGSYTYQRLSKQMRALLDQMNLLG